MHLQGAREDGTTAAAEQLVAEEAREAAQAAAKKAKKQKAKARKQLACSVAVSSSQPTASQATSSQSLASQVSAGSSQTQPKASLLQRNPSDSRSEDMSPDQALDSSQPDSQHRATHETAVNIRPAHTALHEQVATSDISVGGMPAASPAAVEASPGEDARFLDKLFCCPITKVLPPFPFSTVPAVTFDTILLAHAWRASCCAENLCKLGGKVSICTNCGSSNCTPVMHVLVSLLSSYGTPAVCIWQDCCLSL